MPIKFTQSVDGVYRATVWANIRLTTEELEDIRKMAKRDGTSARAFLNTLLQYTVDHSLSSDENPRNEVQEKL